MLSDDVSQECSFAGLLLRDDPSSAMSSEPRSRKAWKLIVIRIASHLSPAADRRVQQALMWPSNNARPQQ